MQRKTQRHAAATGNAGRKHAVRIDTDFADELVDQPGQESHIVDVEFVRAVVADNIARVPIAVVGIGIQDRKATFVGKAVERIPCVNAHLLAVFARAMHRHDKWRTFRQPLRHVESIDPFQPGHLDGLLDQRAGQRWNLWRRRIDIVGEQRTKQRDHAYQAVKAETQKPQKSFHGGFPGIGRSALRSTITDGQCAACDDA